MENKNKGFTLMELLVVIAVIGVLSLIIIPAIINYIQDGKNKYNEELKEQLLVSGKNYYSEKTYLLPKKTYLEKSYDVTSYVTLSELQSQNYTKNDFIDADDRPCKESYVLVNQPRGKTEHNYHSCLICGEGSDIVNYSENDEYCMMSNFNDKQRPSCKVLVDDKDTGVIYNPQKVTLTEIKDDSFSNTGNPVTLRITNITTNKKTNIEVSFQKYENLKTQNLLDKFPKDKKGNIIDGEYEIDVIDSGTNISEKICNDGVKIIIDKTDPTCKLEYLNKQFKLTANDNISEESNIAKIVNKDSKKTGYVTTNIIKPLQDGTYYGHVKDEAGNEGICKRDVKITMTDKDKPYCYLYTGSQIYDLVKRSGELTHKVECYIYKGEEGTIDNSKISAMNGLVNITSVTKNSTENNNKDNKIIVDIKSKVNNTGDGLENINIGSGFIKSEAGSNDAIKVQPKDFKVDSTLPVVTLTNPSNGNWTNQKVIITANVTDSYSGIKSVQYSYDNSTWKTVATENFDTNTVSRKVWTPEYTANRNDTLYVRAIDNAGNISTVKSTTIKIDKTSPTVTLTNSSNGNWTNQKVTITATGSDNGGSGIKKYEYRIDGNSTWKAWSNRSTNGKPLAEWDSERDTTMEVRAIDNAGNISVVKSTPVKIDKTKPSLTTKSTNNGEWVSTKIIVTATATDSKSGIGKLEYRYKTLQNGSWEWATESSWTKVSSSSYDTNTTTKVVWTPEYTSNQNRRIYFRATDKAGNISGEDYRSIKIDKTAPKITFTPNRAAESGGWYKTPLTVTVKCNPSISGKKSFVINGSTKSGTSYPVNFEGSNRPYTINATCTNNAGLTTTESKDIYTRVYSPDSSCSCATYNTCTDSACGTKYCNGSCASYGTKKEYYWSNEMKGTATSSRPSAISFTCNSSNEGRNNRYSITCVSCVRGGAAYAPNCRTPNNNTCNKWNYKYKQCLSRTVTDTSKCLRYNTYACGSKSCATSACGCKTRSSCWHY